MRSMARSAVLVTLLWTLAGCGGGGGGGGGTLSGNPGGLSNGYTPGVFPSASTFANQCAIPRPGTADRTGSTFTENMFLRSWTNDLYLWYSEVPDLNPNGTSTADYFELLKTPARTPSGRPKDQFHFTYPTDVWESLSEAGIEIGYGAQWIILAGTPPRKVVVAYVEPDSSAATMGIMRGAEVLTVDGVDVVFANTQVAVNQLNAAFFPATAGERHTFRLREVDGSIFTVTLTSEEVRHEPVLVSGVIDQGGVPVGYLLFNDHIATAEAQLIEAITALRDVGVQDLILDLRYNGGGYLAIASELAYMIGNTTLTNGRTFERLVFNDKHPTNDPITGRPLEPMPFLSTALGLSAPEGMPLPTLNLDRVYVITGNNTCSASESIINGLRGVGVSVYQIGSTTCGKPYGFYPQDNCGTTYFSIQFEGRNAQNFGEYPDGFTPQNSPDIGSVKLPGCAVADDFTRELGDLTERRLAATLAFRASGNTVCPPLPSFEPLPGSSAKPSLSSAEGQMFKSPARENRILRNELRNSLAF
jgi:carboxyl-terminal processing protease